MVRTFESTRRETDDCERRVYVDLMKFMAHLYRDEDEFGHTWTPSQLQDAVISVQEKTSEEFADDVGFFLDAVYTIGKGSNSTTEKHAAFNVLGDGSCFYQALFYGMLWTSAGELEHVHTIHDLKMLIMERLFRKKNVKDGGKRLQESVKSESDRERRKAKRTQSSLLETLLEDFGMRKLKKSKRRGGKADWKSDNYEWFKTDNAHYVGDALDIQILIYREDTGKTGKATLYEDYNTLTTKFTGKPLVCTLLSSGHFYVLSVQPFMQQGFVSEDGRGVEGKDIPKSIDFLYENKEKIMPYLNMCMLCNKWVLSE